MAIFGNYNIFGLRIWHILEIFTLKNGHLPTVAILRNENDPFSPIFTILTRQFLVIFTNIKWQFSNRVGNTDCEVHHHHSIFCPLDTPHHHNSLYETQYFMLAIVFIQKKFLLSSRRSSSKYVCLFSSLIYECITFQEKHSAKYFTYSRFLKLDIFKSFSPMVNSLVV